MPPADAGGAGEVLVRREHGTWYVTLSNPDRRNALTWRMYDQLDAVCRQTHDDADLRVVVVRGAGGEAFAAGTDIRQFREFRDGADGVAYEHRTGQILAALGGITVPVVAVVEGPAVGAGLAIASFCDVVIATPDAVFGAPIARTLGNCLPPPVVARLRSRLGAGRTMAMLLTSTLLDAETAAVAGLVHEVVPREELETRVGKLVKRLRSAAPLTLAGLKEVDRRLEAAMADVDADDVLERCYGSDDFREGLTAFLEHRRPQWQGR